MQQGMFWKSCFVLKGEKTDFYNVYVVIAINFETSQFLKSDTMLHRAFIYTYTIFSFHVTFITETRT